MSSRVDKSKVPKHDGILRDTRGDLDLSRISVLIIDDNHFIRQLVVQMLRAFGGRTITEANDAADAFKLMKIHKYDLVICDYLMSPLNGVDFTKLVRTAKDSRDQEIPIIMLTGYTEYENVLRMRNSGVNELLAKPVSARSLLTRIIYVFEEPREFIRSEVYTGPDRRRQFVELEGRERRGKGAAVTRRRKAVSAEGVEIDAGWGLSQDEVNELLKDSG